MNSLILPTIIHDLVQYPRHVSVWPSVAWLREHMIYHSHCLLLWTRLWSVTFSSPSKALKWIFKKGAHLVKVCSHFVLSGARFVDFKIPNKFLLEAGRQLIINGRDLLVVGYHSLGLVTFNMSLWYVATECNILVILLKLQWKIFKCWLSAISTSILSQGLQTCYNFTMCERAFVCVITKKQEVRRW